MTDIPSRGSPAWIKWLIALVACAVLGLICLEILNRAATARWQRYAAKLRESGLPLTLGELDAARMPIPDDQNSAKLIEALAAKYADRIDDWRKIGEPKNVMFFGKSSTWPDFFNGVDRKTIEPTRELLARQSDIIEELQPILARPTGRFDFRFKLTPYPQRQVFPYSSVVRTLSKLMWAQAAMALIDGDTNSAVGGTIVAAHIVGSLHGYPSGISLLINNANEAALVKVMIEQILRSATLTDAQLSRLQRALDALLRRRTMKWAWLGQRASFLATCDAVADGTHSIRKLVAARRAWLPMGVMTSSGKVQRRPIAQVPSVGMFSWMPPMFARKNQARGAEMYTWLIEAGDDPIALRGAAKRFDAARASAGKRGALLTLLTFDAGRIVLNHLRTSAMLASAVTVLACERYRQHHGEFPLRLRDLVPGFLDELPTDPFSEAPMLMTATEKGVVIYSVGENETDDGGEVTRRKKNSLSPDVGFRLLRPEHRGLLLIDDSQEEDLP